MPVGKDMASNFVPDAGENAVKPLSSERNVFRLRRVFKLSDVMPENPRISRYSIVITLDNPDMSVKAVFCVALPSPQTNFLK